MVLIPQTSKQTNKPLGANSHLSAGPRNIPGPSLTSGPEGRRGGRRSAQCCGFHCLARVKLPTTQTPLSLPHSLCQQAGGVPARQEVVCACARVCARACVFLHICLCATEIALVYGRNKFDSWSLRSSISNINVCYARTHTHTSHHSDGSNVVPPHKSR